MVIVVVVVIVYLSICLSVYLCVYLQAWKRSYFATLPQFLNWTTSKTKQFCETSSIFELDNTKNEAILWDVLQKWKVECRVGCLVPIGFAIFHSTCLQYCACHEKLMPGHTKRCTCPRKIILANLQIWCSKMQPFRKSAPSPPNISDEHVSCTAPATENASWHTLFKCPTLAIVFRKATKHTKPSRLAHFWEGAQSLAPATQNDIWTSKSVPKPSVFCTFDFEMCFAPQRRALFRHLNFQKWSEPGALCILTSNFASRHNGVHFFDSATSKSAPELRCFVRFDLEMCFVPQRRAFFHLSSGQLAPHPPL